MKLIVTLTSFALLGLGLGFHQIVQAYPIDGYSHTGIKRLDFYNLAQQGIVSGRQLSEGAKLPLSQIDVRNITSNFESLSYDTRYQKEILSFLGPHAAQYGVALVDLSDPDKPLFAAHNQDYQSNVGSVGKIVVALALFQELAILHPNDISARQELLRNTVVTADRFIENDDHKVPIWDVEKRQLQYRPLRKGDQASLWEYLDWTLSASSNAAAAMLAREVILLRQFGTAYPVSEERTQEFFTNASSTDLRHLMLEAFDKVLTENGIDTKHLRQGSFFTRYGKNRVGGVTSFGTPGELMRLLFQMERGELVDEFTSSELKRMLYMTQKRIRYASHPALNNYAVYFKSGSLYSCEQEEGFICGKYKGNKRNTLASVAIVESAELPRQFHYMVVVISNVLKINSAVAHQTLALRIHRMIEKRQNEKRQNEEQENTVELEN